jgi:hypothetical protein
MMTITVVWRDIREPATVSHIHCRSPAGEIRGQTRAMPDPGSSALLIAASVSWA